MANSIEFTKFFWNTQNSIQTNINSFSLVERSSRESISNGKNSRRKFIMQEHIQEDWDNQSLVFHWMNYILATICQGKLIYCNFVPKQKCMKNIWNWLYHWPKKLENQQTTTQFEKMKALIVSKKP
jgi:hypothetical protein